MKLYAYVCAGVVGFKAFPLFTARIVPQRLRMRRRTIKLSRFAFDEVYESASTATGTTTHTCTRVVKSTAMHIMVRRRRVSGAYAI